MTNLVPVLASLTILFVSAAPAEGQWREQQRQRGQYEGLEIMLGGGLNKCMEDGDADCDDIDPSGVLLVAPGYRLYLDIAYGWLSPDLSGKDIPDEVDVDVSMATLTVMPTFRLFAALDKAELYGGAGVGYSSLLTKGEETSSNETVKLEAEWSHTLNMKLTGGVAFQATENAFVGVNVDYVFNANDKGDIEVCITVDGNKECVSPDDEDDIGDVADLVQLTGFIRFRF